MTGFHEVSEYLGFILMNLVDFFMAMGVLYLSLKMGQNELKEKLMQEERKQQENIFEGMRGLPGASIDGRKDYTTASLNRLLNEQSGSQASSLKQQAANQCFTFDTANCKRDTDQDIEAEEYNRF